MQPNPELEGRAEPAVAEASSQRRTDTELPAVGHDPNPNAREGNTNAAAGLDPNELLDLAAVAASAKCHPSTMRRRILSGEIPAVKVGGKYKIRRADLDFVVEPVVTAEDLEIERAVDRLRAELPPLTQAQREELGRLFSL